MEYQTRIEHFSGKPLAVVRRRATKQELSKVIPEACGTVWNVVRARQIKGAGRHVAVYFDDVFNLEVGVELESPFSGDGEVIGSSLPAGQVATTTHFGPYQRLGEGHEAIQQWCRTHQRETLFPSWEIYGHWIDDWNKDPSRIRTDVYYLLKATGLPVD